MPRNRLNLNRRKRPEKDSLTYIIIDFVGETHVITWDPKRFSESTSAIAKAIGFINDPKRLKELGYKPNDPQPIYFSKKAAEGVLMLQKNYRSKNESKN